MEGNKKKLALIAGAAIILAVGAFGLINSMNKKPSGTKVDAAAKRSLLQSTTITGKIEAGSSFEAVLNTSQKVKEIFNKAGDVVKAGDTIIKLDTSDLEYQLGKASLSLEALRKSTALQRDQAQLSLDNAKSQYSLALKSYNNTKVLFDHGMAALDALNASGAALKTAENQVKNAELQYSSLEDASGKSDKKDQMDSYSLDIANFNRKISESSIKSTINGTITILDGREGQYPVQNSKVQVVDLSSLMVKINVAQEDAVLIKSGQQCTVKVKGLDGQYTGTVTRISDAASETANSAQPKFQVEISIDNPNGSLRAGYEGDITIKLREKADALSVSYGAVKVEDSRKKYVFVISGGKAAKRYVTTGIETRDYIEILEGLKDGEQYIALPSETLKEGDAVNAVLG
ncbi:MAG: efflux RND transporter periplasmic adaptor subunit [Solirubrobacterales bacterium]